MRIAYGDTSLRTAALTASRKKLPDPSAEQRSLIPTLLSIIRAIGHQLCEIAMKLLGDSMGPVVWDVIGNSCSLRDHVSRQSGRKVNVHEAKGRLIAGLDLLARHWKLLWMWSH